MGAVKDYYMWLEHNGYSERDSDDDLIAEYKNDEEWHQTQPSHGAMINRNNFIEEEDGDYFIEEDDDDGIVIDDGDYEGPNDMGWTPEEQWFRPDGGLTGEAWDFLATTDSQGDFI